MRFHQTDSSYILILEQGDLALETIQHFCEEHEITNATFTGIGAVRNLTCGYYALEEKRYYFTDYPSDVEVVSLSGNVMQKRDAPFVHAHGVFTDTENRAFGGHIKEMVVAVTLEVVLTPLTSSLTRVDNERIGLALIHCPGA